MLLAYIAAWIVSAKMNLNGRAARTRGEAKRGKGRRHFAAHCHGLHCSYLHAHTILTASYSQAIILSNQYYQ